MFKKKSPSFLIKGFGILIGIASISIGVYYGVQWWKHAGLKEEENAAIITAIAALVTLVGTVVMNYRSQQKTQRSFVHSRIYDKKIEVYTEMAEQFHEMNAAYFAYDYTEEKKYGEQVREIYFYIINRTIPKHLLFISNEVLDLINDMYVTIPTLKESEKEMEDKYDRFTEEYYEPLIHAFRKELGTESITEELREMIESQSSTFQRLF
jgi:hypothetical protein